MAGLSEGKILNNFDLFCLSMWNWVKNSPQYICVIFSFLGLADNLFLTKKSV